MRYTLPITTGEIEETTLKQPARRRRRFGGREGARGRDDKRGTQRDRTQGRSGEAGTMPTFRSAKTPEEPGGRTLSNLPAQKLVFPAHLTHPGGARPGSIVSSDPGFEAWDYVYDQLKDATPGQLVNITHLRDGARAKNCFPGIKGVKISNGDILDEYGARQNIAARSSG